MQPIQQGSRVGGFVVEYLLGKGGMASVWLATQVRLQRPVALKVLAPALAADEQFVQRFQLEGVNAARLEHPNIVPVYEAGEDAGHVYLAMKYVDGSTLKGLLIERGTLGADDAMRILGDVGRSLDYSHRLGFVHRDVKPANVLLTREGHVYLSDFGLTKAVGQSSITSTGQWMGTPEYMPPEQARGEQVDHRADLYSFACVAFECLTAAPPFSGDNPVALIIAHSQQEIPAATTLNLSLPPGVDTVLRRGLAKHPSERYSSAVELLESLGAALEERRLTSAGMPADDIRRFAPPAAVPTPAPAPQPAVAPPPSPAPIEAQARPLTPTPASSTECPVCFGRLAVGYSFCGDCGTRIQWCSSCSGPVVYGDRFCQHCGSASVS